MSKAIGRLQQLVTSTEESRSAIRSPAGRTTPGRPGVLDYGTADPNGRNALGAQSTVEPSPEMRNCRRRRTQMVQTNPHAHTSSVVHR